MLEWLRHIAQLAFILEWAAVILSIAYVFLAARQNKWCWVFGGVSSLISIALFIMVRLYAESILYVFYVIMAVVGWFAWQSAKSESKEISEMSWLKHLLFLGIGLIASATLYYLFATFTKAALPLIDSITTAFSILTTYLTVKKVLSNWLYWIVIDALSVYLYWSRGLDVYALLMLLYTAMAIYGFIEWKKVKSVAVQ